MPEPAATGGERVHVTVTGRGVHDALGDLRAAGLEVDETLDRLGIVTGRAAPDVVARIRALPGLTVEPEVDVHLPPPDAALE
jgi:hypothetical protein